MWNSIPYADTDLSFSLPNLQQEEKTVFFKFWNCLLKFFFLIWTQYYPWSCVSWTCCHISFDEENHSLATSLPWYADLLILHNSLKKQKCLLEGYFRSKILKKTILMGENPRTQLLEKAWVGGEGRKSQLGHEANHITVLFWIIHWL